MAVVTSADHHHHEHPWVTAAQPLSLFSLSPEYQENLQVSIGETSNLMTAPISASCRNPRSPQPRADSNSNTSQSPRPTPNISEGLSTGRHRSRRQTLVHRLLA